jgi:hypothetical protein
MTMRVLILFLTLVTGERLQNFIIEYDARYHFLNFFVFEDILHFADILRTSLSVFSLMRDFLRSRIGFKFYQIGFSASIEEIMWFVLVY